MKKIFILALVLFGIQFVGFSQITWDGGGSDNNFNTAANWSGDVVPGNGDDVIFDGTSTKNCDFDIDIDVANFSINSGYTGTIDALTSLPVINGVFTQAAGTFISTDEATLGMVIGGGMTHTGGTFTHNNGRVTFAVDAGTTSISGALTFNILAITSNGISTAQRNVNFGTSVAASLVLNGSSRLFGYQGSIDVTSNLTISGTNTGNPTSNSGTISFTGAGPISIAGAGAAARNKLPNIVMNTSGNYSMSGHLNLQGNWTGTQGILSPGSSTTNFYNTANVIGPAAAFDNLTTQTGVTLTFPANEEVFVARSITNSGTMTFPSTTTLSLSGGSTAQTISGNGFTVGGIHAYSGGRTITLSAPVTILDFLDIDGASMTFAAGTNLTLNSTNALTARVGPLGTGSSITGNVTVETVIPGGNTGWAVLGPRGVNGQTIASWDTYVSSGGTTGMPMTCTLCANHPSVIGTGTNAFVSVQGWNEPGGTYTELIATDALTPGVGIWAYVGDGFLASNDLTLINTGTLKTGLVSIPVTVGGLQSGFNLVANPYPSPISWTAVMSNLNNVFSLNNAIYAFSADQGQTAYVSGAASHPAPSGIDDIIPGGQGFYIEASAGGTIEFEESHKVSNNTSANPIIRSTSTSSVGQLFRIKLQGAFDNDITTFRIHGNATDDFDKRYDAKKLFQSPGYVGFPGAYDKYTSISSKDNGGVDYSIQSLAPLLSSMNIPVLARVSASGSFTISAFDFKDFPMCVGLIDKLDNSYHDLRLSPYVCNISDTTSAPRFELVLCKDESLNAVGVSEISESNSIFITQDAQGAYVKTVFEKNTKAIISVYNIIGQKLMKDVTVEGMVTTTALPIDLHNQVVIIKVTTDKETVTKKMVLH